MKKSPNESMHVMKKLKPKTNDELRKMGPSMEESSTSMQPIKIRL